MMARIAHPALVNPRRWRALRQFIIKRSGHRCQSCGRAFGRAEVDHIIPVARGGDWWAPENLQALCRSPCHFAKSAGERRRAASDPERDAWKKLITDAMQ